MPKRKLTKHEDDIRRGLRPIYRYEPRARSHGGPWRMVKCKDGAYVDAEQHDEVVEYLRKSAENSLTQSPHDGIHTCSKGCSKPGCTRALRDTIQEQNLQIEALKRDLLEATAEKRKKAMQTIHDINQIGGLQEENARLKAEVERVQAQSYFYRNKLMNETAYTANVQLIDQVKHLEAQVERLTKAGDNLVYVASEHPVAEPFVKAWHAAKQGGQP